MVRDVARWTCYPGFSRRVHPIYRTPDFSTWVAGFLVGIPAGLLDIGTLADLSNIGTLFAFALVAGGVLILRFREPDRPRSFRAPGGLLAPIVTILSCLLLMAGLPITNWIRFFVWLVIGLIFYHFYGTQAQRSLERKFSCCQGGFALMRRWLCAGFIALTLILLFSLRSSFGWGENAERLITNKAVDTLPDEMLPFFEANRQYLVQHVTEPEEAKSAAEPA